jgi:hypothetical protein
MILFPNTNYQHHTGHRAGEDGSRDDECVSNTSADEEGRAVVDDEVDTGELLETLKHNTGPCTESVPICSVTEAVPVAVVGELTLSLESLCRYSVGEHTCEI